VITTAADLDRLIPTQRYERTVTAGAALPYEMGDLVAVLVTDFLSLESKWIPGTVLHCRRPEHAIRFTCQVAIGDTSHCPVTIERVYCWEDGNGESITRLDEEHPGLHLARLNAPAPDLLSLATA
jgi:hypothetical protein